MKLITYEYKGTENAGVLTENEKAVIPFSAFGLPVFTIGSLPPL